jgi:hypothetical protein
MIDTQRIDEVVLALLHVGLHEGNRTWKSFDWGACARRGWSPTQIGKARSVVPTEQGLKESQRLFESLITR